MLRPGVAGIGVELGLPVGGFVDVIHLPSDPGRWPAIGTVTGFVIWWTDERPQIRLMPADPRYRREDFTSWIQEQDTPAARAFRAQQPAGPGTTHASFEHPWLGSVRRHGDDQLIAHINVPPAIRPARANGDTDAEVLIEGASAAADPRMLADDASARVQAALTCLDAIKAYADEHAPELLTRHQLPAPPSLGENLFLEGFTIAASYTEIAFDYGALDMIVVRAGTDGQCHSVSLCP
jgi:hypothetical protein